MTPEVPTTPEAPAPAAMEGPLPLAIQQPASPYDAAGPSGAVAAAPLGVDQHDSAIDKRERR